MKRQLIVLPLFASLFLYPMQSFCQDAPPAPADEIKLNDGSVYRGTIVESVPDKQTTLMLINGEQRTFEAKDIAYAGPIEKQAEAKVDDKPAPVSSEAHFEFKGKDGKRLTLMLHTGSSFARAVGNNGATAEARAEGYKTVCISPCKTTIPKGMHRFAVTDGNAIPIVFDPVEIKDGTKLEGDFVSNNSIRLVGLATMVVSSLVGGYYLYDGVYAGPKDEFGISETDTGKITTGLVVIGVGQLLALPFILWGDDGALKVENP